MMNEKNAGSLPSDSERLYRMLLDESNNIVQVSDYSTMEILYANRKAAEFAGRSQEEMAGTRCYEYMMHRKLQCEFCDLSGLTAEGRRSEYSLNGRHFLISAKRLTWEGRDAFVEYVTDVTEQKNAEIALRMEQEKTALALENANIFIWEYDPVRHVSIQQPKAMGLFSVPAVMENVPEKAIDMGIISPESQSEYAQLYRRIDEGAPVSEARIRMKIRQEEWRWLKLRLKAVFDEAGTPIRAAGLGVDITEQVEAEGKFFAFWNYRQAMAKNTIVSFRMNLTQNWCGDGVSDYPEMLKMNADGTVDGLFSSAYQRFLTKEELKSYQTIFSRQRLLELYEQGCFSPSLEYRCSMDEGKPRWIRAMVDMQKNPATGDVVALMYAFDIDREKTNEAIISKVVGEDYDFIMLVDMVGNSFSLFLGKEDGVIVPPQCGNDYDAMMVETNRSGVVPQEVERAVHDMSRQVMLDHLSRAKVFVSVYHAIGSDGGVRCKKIRYSWLDKSLGHVIITRSDVTEEMAQQQRQQELLRSALAQAEQASNAKTDFLSKMSHEIRTPMNAIIGMNALAAQNLHDSEQAADCIAKVGISARYLLSLINDILDMSRIESGKLHLREERIPFEEFLNGVNNLVYEQATEKGLSYDSIIAGFVAETYLGDAMKLQQILINLLGNAVKFTPKGGKVQLIVHQERVEQNKAIVKFTVNDTGMGISEEFQKVMFEPFEQGINGATSPYAGTGLGLAITKNLVQLMGGSVAVNSIVGIGTEFVVTLPLQIVEGKSSANLANILPLDKMSALVVDDEILICQQVKALLQDIGLKAEWADSGYKAVDIVHKRWADQKYFDIILIDWKMPDMDGIETARRIRKIVGPDVTIIIITAYEWAEIEREAKAAGVNMLVTKPLFKSSLISTFERAFGSRNSGKSGPAVAAEYNFTGCRALLVEDHLLNVEVARRLLGAKGMKVEVAENGVAAIEAFASAPPNYFDIILMDIRMPLMDGLAATRSIRVMKKETAKTIPIIAMSANAFDDDVEKSRAAGMNAHLSKPIEPQLLYETVARFLRKEDEK